MPVNNSADHQVTQYNIITGGASNTLNNVAPSATSGVPIISQGASSQPIFGTALVAGGGTGNTSATAYAVLCGGTTSTGAYQSIASVGTTGQVLTSNGASALPTFQAAGGGSGGGSTSLILYDDFTSIWKSSTSGLSGAYPYYCPQGSPSFNPDSTNITSGHPGMITNASFSSDVSVFLGGNITQSGIYMPIILGGGVLTLNWIIKIITLSISSPRYVLRCGLGDTFDADQVNGVYFEYSDNINSGNWNIKTASSSTRTTTNTSVSVTAAFHNLQLVVNAAASSVTFSIDGVSQTPITTNIPTTAVTVFLDAVGVTGTTAAGSFSIDAFYLNQTLTTPR